MALTLRIIRLGTGRWQKISSVLLATLPFVFLGCHTAQRNLKPAIQITRVPAASLGGPRVMDYMEGKVSGTQAGDQVVLYAFSEVWWIQPFRNAGLTNIQPDSSWRNSTHLGTDYAALLVEPGYRPALKLGSIPSIGNGVLATAIVKGSGATIVPKRIHFSGYDWTAQGADNDTAGETQSYDPNNAWVDEKGYLHLRMNERDGHWYCAEIHTMRSLGYGTYRFVVQDTGHLDSSATFRIFAYDLLLANESRNDEFDIELSRWDDPAGNNARYVLQPYYVPKNVAKFEAPAGELTHTFRWDPGKVSFRTVQGAVDTPGQKIVSEKVFTEGVPVPANHKIYIDLLDFLHSRHTAKLPTEVVIEKFDYQP
ncbi:LamG domain-containing protein [Granulicella aggregans]|uniref:hypothetical protein n=1 Tax=Granulicella aggregans TaxID=474949 RepID=UPI0021E03DE2|nr:hypothetical protein [Granulicella aggregans]